MALDRTAIVSCAVLIATTLAAVLLVRGGGGDGPFHVIDTAATPTVELADLPPPSRPAARAERTDLNQLALTTLILLSLAAATVLVTLLGVIGSENLARKGRRVIEVMLGAPPRWLVGAAARLWRRRLLIAGSMGGGLCAAGVVWLMRAAPAGTSVAAPALWPVAAVLLLIAGLVFATGVAPVRRLYARGRSLSGEADNRQYTDPRPQQFDRILLITAQLAISVAILAGSGLLVLASAGRPILPRGSADEQRSAEQPGAAAESGGTYGTGTGLGQTVVGTLAANAERAADSASRAAIYQSALVALQNAPGLAAESLSTPGAWVGRGPEVIVENECGPCVVGDAPHPVQHSWVQVHAVMPGFFTRRGMRFVDGYGFEEDHSDPGGEEQVGAGASQRSVVINQSYAEAHFMDPVGRRLTLDAGAEEVWYEVVGVVSDAPRGGLGNSGSPYAVYYSALDHPPAEIELVAAVDVPPGAGLDDSLRVVRQALDTVAEGDLVITGFKRADDELDRVYGTAGWLGSGTRTAGVLAALVALAGVAGTLRAHVRSRLREMGIRSAVGAPPRTLHRMVVREAVRIAAAGTGLGLWVATFVVAFLSPDAVGIFSLPLYVAVAVLFIGSAVLVALPSARLAALADPREVMEG